MMIVKEMTIIILVIKIKINYYRNKKYNNHYKKITPAMKIT